MKTNRSFLVISRSPCVISCMYIFFSRIKMYRAKENLSLSLSNKYAFSQDEIKVIRGTFYDDDHESSIE